MHKDTQIDSRTYPTATLSNDLVGRSILVPTRFCPISGKFPPFTGFKFWKYMLQLRYFEMEDDILIWNTLLAFYQKSPWVASNLQLKIFGTLFDSRSSVITLFLLFAYPFFFWWDF